MPRRKLTFTPGKCYHLYNRGVNRQNIFFSRDNNLHFLRLIRRHLIDPGTAEILAYCLMPNHYHLLIHLKRAELSQAMHRLSMSYAKAINKRCKRTGPLFQGPFRSILVDEDEYLLNLSRYIHLNPVKAGLVRRVAEWEFSSYHEYAGLRDGSLPNPTLVKAQLDHQTYAQFVEAEAISPPQLQPLLLDS